MSDDRLKDIPELARDASNLQSFAKAVREVLQTFRGYRGDKRDIALTPRNLTDGTLYGVTSGGGVVINVGGGTVLGGGGGGGGTYTPDPTPPPTPTGLAVSAGISFIAIEHDVPGYTEGHGHDRTVLYGAKWPDGGTEPSFSDAVVLCDFQGTFGTYPSDPATRWCLWIKWKSIDGYESTSPAGGTHGAQTTTGQDVRLLLDALTDAALKPSSPYTKVSFRADQFYIAPNANFVQETTPTGTVVGQLWLKESTGAWKRWTGSTWATFSVPLMFIVQTAPTTINGVSIPAGVYMDSAYIYDLTASIARMGNAWITNAMIDSLSASKITAGSIAVGAYAQSTGFVAGTTGWILRGDGTAEFGAAYIRGQLVASQINANGLTIRDGSGNIILNASGSGSLDWRFLAQQPGPNLIRNPEFANDANGILAPQGWSSIIAGSPTNSQVLRPTTAPSYGAPWNLNAPFLYAGVDAPSESVQWITSDYIEVNETENYTLACWARWGTTSDTRVYLGCACYDNTGALLGSVYPTLSFSTLTGTWTRYPGVIGPAGAVAWPAGTVKVKVRWFGAYNTSGTSYTGRSFATRFTFNQGLNATNSYLPFDPSAVTAYNRLTSANIAVYVASAAIGWAQIGDLEISTDGAISSGQTAYDTGTGYWIGFASGVPKLSIGNATKALLWSGTGLSIRGDIVATGNIVSGSVTAVVRGDVTTAARSGTTTGEKTTTKTIGSIVTSSNGDGRVELKISPNASSSVIEFALYNMLAEASVTTGYYYVTLRFRVKRGATVLREFGFTDRYIASAASATMFLFPQVINDTPGAGVTATYSIEVYSRTGTAAGLTDVSTTHAHEIVDFNYSLTELKK